MSDTETMYRLVFLEGPDKGRRVVVRQASVEAGADPDLRIRLDDPAAQEHHAVFIRDHGKVHVETSMEAQPFVLNGNPLGREPLRHGDVLELGRLRLQYQEMQPLVFDHRRRLSRLHLVTIAATFLILVVQGVLLALVLVRHHEQPLPEPLVEETTVDEAEEAEEATSMSLLPELRPASSETEWDVALVEDPEDDVFASVDIVKPELLPDPEPTVIERPSEIIRPPPEETVAAEPEVVTVDPPEPEPEALPEPEFGEEPERPVVVVAEMAGEEAADASPLNLDDLPRRIRIAEVAREKFEPGPGLDEVRGARVVLRPRRSMGDVDPAEVRVEITFYDRDEFTGDIAPTLVPAATPTPKLGGGWPAGEAKILQYRYEVPQRFRTGDTAGHTYYGHSVQLYYRGKLEDAYAFPESLLDF